MSKSNERILLEHAIEKAIRCLGNYEVGSEEYAKTLDQVVELHKMLVADKTASVSRDTLAVIGANLLGILLIISHEYVGVVSQKAVSLLLKPRV